MRGKFVTGGNMAGQNKEKNQKQRQNIDQHALAGRLHIGERLSAHRPDPGKVRACVSPGGGSMSRVDIIRT